MAEKAAAEEEPAAKAAAAPAPAPAPAAAKATGKRKGRGKEEPEPAGTPLELCALILGALTKRKDAYWFAEPVPKDTEGYFEMISSPMDYGSIQTKLEAATKRLASLEQQLPLSPKGGQEVMSSAAWRSEKAKQSSPRVNAGAAVRVAAGAGQAQGGYRRSHRIGHHGPLPLQACPPICLGNGISAALTAWVHRAGARKGDARACAGQAGGGWCGQ